MNTPGSVEAIILAAGSSVRLQMFKPGALLFGSPLIDHCIQGLRHCCERIIVVGGNRIELLTDLLARGREYTSPAVELVENPDWEQGMFTSIRTGIAHVRAERFFVLPVDCPRVPPDVHRLLLAEDANVVVPAYFGKRGHPILLHRSIIADIVHEPEQSSLRAVVSRAGIREVSVGAPEVLFDIDTPDDLDRITRMGRAI
jgi:molybdenum cofactor cytidylyltransferase